MEPKKLFFELSKELKYSSKGEFLKTSTLEFRPPSMGEFREVNKLSQLVTNAVLDARGLIPEGQNVDDAIQKDPTGDEIKVILFASKNVDFNDIYKVFKPVAKACGTYDSKEKLADSVFDKMGIEDNQRLVCEFIAAFIFPSLFSMPDSQK